MKWVLHLSAALLLVSTISAVVDEKEFELIKKMMASVDSRVQDLQKTVETQRNVMTALARQVSQQQLHAEETTRSHGDSGLKITRLTRTGSKTYFSTTFSDQRVASIHEHSNYRGIVGMGELVAVLNGVEFRTRHNDYKMKMPSRNSTEYGATEDIPYPEVPPEVLAKPTLNLQIEELREWFKAWKNSDYSKRDYRKYFKANLCYLEGQWTNAKGTTIEEPFASDRHAIDAKSFFDLQTKIRYTSVTGRKSLKENYAYLPTTISDVDEHGNIVYAQWNYRILCHPLKRHVPLSRFRLEEDLAPRVANGKSFERQFNERAARFSLYEDIKDTVTPSKKDSYVRDQQGKFLDMLMAEVPGRDNYPANIIDDAFGETAYKYNANIKDPKTKPLNVGYYHNTYKVNGNDAMGVSIGRRGFSDANLYVAYNTQPKVSLTKVDGRCRKNPKCNIYLQVKTRCDLKECPKYAHRVSYAIPLEIIYTTPLQTWNPYKLAHFSGARDQNKPASEKRVNNVYRNGGTTKDKAYYGTSDKYYYFTPETFYDKLVGGKADPADTVRRNAVGVLDRAGNIRRVMASGISIMTKDIPGIGPMRLRYPVMPIHDYGNVIHKEMQALADMTLKKHKYQRLYPDVRLDNGTIEEIFMFETNSGTKDPPGPHIHTMELTMSQVDELKAGKYITLTTSTNGGHNHEIVVYYNKKWNVLGIRKCDGSWSKCWDGHSGKLICPDCRFGSPVN